MTDVGTEMHRAEADRLLALIEAERVGVVGLNDVSTHFAMGAFYALERAETIVRRVHLDNPTCLIHCRQESEEE